jgi:hypothetical protein
VNDVAWRGYLQASRWTAKSAGDGFVTITRVTCGVATIVVSATASSTSAFPFTIRGHSAEVPLGAHVGWSRSQQNPHAFFGHHAHEVHDIAIARQAVELPFGRPMMISEDVRRDRLEAERLRHADLVPPVFGGDTCRMHLAGADLQWGTVDARD